MALKLRPCHFWQLRAFRKLLTRYFCEDLHIPINEKQARGLTKGIWNETALGVPLTLALWDGVPVGFIDYQLDWEGSSWCWHKGWGCVRELYVQPEARGRGIGRALAQQAEDWARERGAARIYLTADDGIPFWQVMGYRRTGRINHKNGLEEMEKDL